MKILFMGSIPTYQHDESRELTEQELPFVRACEEMGYAAAARGHEILLGDDQVFCADHHIMNGIIRFCEENQDKNVQVHVSRTEAAEIVFKSLPPNIEINRMFSQEIDRTKYGSRSLIANLCSLDASDVLVIIGGKLTVRLLGNIAADRELAVLAIPSFGGTSASLFERLKYYYRNALKDKYQELSLVQSIWQDDSGEKIISLAEALSGEEPEVKTHSYFISYNWEDSSHADHIEVLLRRKNRKVNRDESIFNAGVDLSDVVKSLIDESDTFIGLWSEKYNTSTWCPHELEYARQKRANGENPKRVVLLTLDDKEPPITFTDSTRLAGDSRELRELGLRKLVEQE